MKIKTLLKDVILGRRLKQEFSTTLIIPEEAQQSKRIASTLIPVEVMEIGSKFRFAHEVKVGDIVYVSKFFGNQLPYGHEDIRMYDGEDVMAIKTI